MIYPAKWWFAWRPVRTMDTERIVWLRYAYRERWGKTRNYFERPLIKERE